MDIFTVLSYLNKISLAAFVITAGFLGYQFYLLKKESNNNSQKKDPKLPDFNENVKVDVANFTRLPASLTNSQNKTMKKETKTMTSLVLGVGLLVLTLAVFIIVRSKQQPNQISQVILPTPTPLLAPTQVINRLPTPGLAGSLTNNTATLAAVLSPTDTPTPTLTPTSTPVLTPTTAVSSSSSSSSAASLSVSPSPTEVIVAIISPTVSVTGSTTTTPAVSPTTIATLPLTGVIDKTVIFFGVASSLILFAFVF